MSDAPASHRREMFQRDHLAWTTLHHFLPADLLRDLCSATVSVVTEGESTLEQLFSENLLAQGGVTNTWALEPRPVSGDDLEFLQRHIRALAWENDADVYFRSSEQDQDPTPSAYLAEAIRLGRLDLDARPYVLKALRLPEGSSVAVLATAIRQASIRVHENHGDDGLDELLALEKPLQGVALKHLGDLFADVDQWALAAKAYSRASHSFLRMQPGIWDAFIEQMSDIVMQSEAMAMWTLDGPEFIAQPLAEAVAKPQDRSRLIVLNGAHDAMVAAVRSEAFGSTPDRRPTVLYPPQLINTFDVGSALRDWQNGRYDDAYRHFWSVLRRQTALGGISETRSTKASYARALIAQASEDKKTGDRTTFALGVRLLVESGSAKAAETTRFTAEVVERYVDQDLISDIFERVERHNGSRSERTMVLLEILRQWVPELPRDGEALAAPMLEWIVKIAHGPVTFESNRNQGGRGLQVLTALAELQPQFRSLVAEEVSHLVVQKIGNEEFWTGQSDALKLAYAYKDVWSGETLSRVTQVVLDLLAAMDPDREFWHLVRPALEFLNSTHVAEAARADPVLGSQFFSSVLRLGMAQKSESIQTLFSLSKFEKDIVLSEEDQNLLADVIANVQQRATQQNSGNATDFIRALLASAGHSGADGVKLAVNSLNQILRSSENKRPSPAFSYAYGPIIDLARNAARVREKSGIDAAKFQELIDSLGESLVVAWGAISLNPSLLAPFSIPVSRTPHPTIVHNWSVATVWFCKHLSDPNALNEALDTASTHPEFGNQIRIARIGAGPNLPDATGLQAIGSESAQIFYPALASRLASIYEVERDEGAAIIEALVKRCLRIGPKELDLAVFTAALGFADLLNIPEAAFGTYLSVLTGDLRVCVGPAVYALEAKLTRDKIEKLQ